MHYKKLNSFKHFRKRKNDYYDIGKLLRRRKSYPRNMYVERMPEPLESITIKLTKEQQKHFQDLLTRGT